MSLTDVLLRDEYETPLASGAVNNTLATDGVNARTVTDTENKISISGGALVQSGGRASPGYGDPRLLYPNVTRVPGLIALFQLTKTNVGGLGRFGWYSDANGHCGVMPYTGALYFIAPGGAGTIIGSFPNNTSVLFALALRASGEMIFMNSGSGWRLLYIHAIHAGAVRMSYDNYDDAITSDFARIAGYWLPVPIVSDGFSTLGTSDGLGHAETSGVGSGGSGVSWSGATWSVSGGKAVNTPVPGSENVANGNMESGTPPTGWTTANSALSVGSERTGGGGTRSLTVTGDGVNAFNSAFQNVFTVGKWYSVSGWIKNNTASYCYIQLNGGVLLGGTQSGTSWVQRTGTIRATVSTFSLVINSGAAATSSSFDDISAKELTLSSLLSLHTSSTPDVFIGIDLAVAAGTQAGLALNWDSTSSPANGVIAYHDGINAKLEKCVAGTWTTVISAAATYSANARLVVSKIGTAYRLYYNNALVGSGTISDSGVANNTKHGLFSTDPSNTLDNYTCYASGSGGEYATAFDIAVPASGASAGTAGTTANASRKRTADGASAGTGSASGVTSVRRNVTGQSNGTGSASGAGMAKRLASGQCAGTGSASGVTSVRRNVTGQSNGTGSANATSSRKRLANGVAEGNGTATIHNYTTSATISS